MVKLKKIIVGTDFSDSADCAIAQATHLARRFEAELILVHVGGLPEHSDSRIQFGPYEPEFQRWEQWFASKLRSQFEELGKGLSRKGIRVSQATREGRPAEGICNAADELGADLVVVGSQGRSGLKRLLLGSTAEKVIRLCRATVLLARPPARPAGYHRILVAVNFDKWSDASVELALAMASDDATIELTHCWHLPHGLVESWGSSESSLVAGIRTSMIERVDARLNEMTLFHRRPGVRLFCEQFEATARDGIHHTLQSGKHDLVVLGSHGRQGLQRWFVGSVAEATVRHAPCSAVVAKSP